MTDYKKYINTLRKCAKEHEDDRTSFGHIIVSDLCKDTANLLESLEQEPCEDCITLRLEKGTLKYSDKDYVVYKKEWLKKWWQPELALLGIELPSIQPTAKENLVVGDCISRQAVLDKKFLAYSWCGEEIEAVAVEDIESLPNVQPKPKTDVLDKIRAEIEQDAFKDVNGSKFIFVNRVNQIIDKYKAENISNCDSCKYQNEVDGSNCYECVKGIRDNYTPNSEKATEFLAEARRCAESEE